MTSEEVPISEELKGCYENLIVIDVGANLTNKKYGRDLDSVIQRAKDAGVQKIMVTGTSVRSSKEALRLTRLYPSTIYSTAGVHPHDAKSMSEEELWMELASTAAAPECVAVGECGLNYTKDFSEPSVQREVFKRQGMELPEPTNLEPLEKKIPQRYTHNDLVLDFLKKCLDKDPLARGTCEQLLRHAIFENFLFAVPRSDHDDFEKARRTQMQSSPMLPLIVSERAQPKKKLELDSRAHLPTI